ncbi:MAG: hypothetical protein FJZ64_04310 [Chlamydiae bacterium]|nr:hypothetical protein [Chlamydiota bacterium]
MKRYPLTLFEVCIALGLAAVVLSFLFSSLFQTVRLSHLLTTLKGKSRETTLCYTKLLHAFSHADPSTIQFEEDRVTFSFENGLDPSLRFSGKRQATLHWDKALVLDIIGKDCLQTETLLSEVEEIWWDDHKPEYITLHLNQKEFVFFL